ncbi:unnamed protein product [Ilex paraguariensis]|uniref:Uncharacterized protein n=1 Tax=Ilex paraguariensis TaxID=185542 RepID=A0ABC8TSF6_9AQUA
MRLVGRWSDPLTQDGRFRPDWTNLPTLVRVKVTKSTTSAVGGKDNYSLKDRASPHKSVAMKDAILMTLKKVTKRKDAPSICASGLLLRIARVVLESFQNGGSCRLWILIHSDCTFVGLLFPTKQVIKA